MKREDLRTKLIAAGINEENLASVVDYIMAANGADVEGFKKENETLKASHKEALEAIQEENKTLKAQVGQYKDYEDLKKFKAETLEKAETSKKMEFLKANGCKHPDLIMSKLDFTKGVYDEEKKTYTGLDDDVKGLREAYGDLFEAQGTQKITPAQQGQSSNTFLDQYLAENPGMAKFINQN